VGSGLDRKEAQDKDMAISKEALPSLAAGDKKIGIESAAMTLQTSDIPIEGRPTFGYDVSGDDIIPSLSIMSIQREMEDLQHQQRRTQMELSQSLIDLRAAEMKFQLFQFSNRSVSTIMNDTLLLYSTLLPILAKRLNLNHMNTSTNTSMGDIIDNSYNDAMIWQSIGFPSPLSAICYIARTLADS
jgi:hypothetical protein